MGFMIKGLAKKLGMGLVGSALLGGSGTPAAAPVASPSTIAAQKRPPWRSKPNTNIIL